jgi:hypothetical protein
MTRALLPLLGRSLLMLALCGAAIGCGDDDDDDDPIGGSGGKSGSGGKGGSSGKGGAGGATATEAECIEDFGKVATTLSDVCVECACDENAAAVASCGDKCWALIACVGMKCADATTEAETAACAPVMCSAEVTAAASAMQLVPAMTVGPILQGTKCASKCLPPAPPGDDAGDDDASVDAGN